MLDAHREQRVADLIGSELGAVVSLEALNGERDLIKDLLQEIEDIGCGAPRIERRDEVARAVVDEGVLVQARGELHGVHLHPLVGQGRAIAERRLRALGRAQRRRFVALEDSVDGLQSKVTALLPAQLLLDAPRANVAFPAQPQIPLIFLLKNLALGAGLRPAALRDQSCLAPLLVPAQPLPERRAGDAAAATHQADVTYLLVEPDPC